MRVRAREIRRTRKREAERILVIVRAARAARPVQAAKPAVKPVAGRPAPAKAAVAPKPVAAKPAAPRVAKPKVAAPAEKTPTGE